MVKCGVFHHYPVKVVNVDDEIKTDRWPLRLEGTHKDHGYVVLLDSHYAITDVKKKATKKS